MITLTVSMGCMKQVAMLPDSDPTSNGLSSDLKKVFWVFGLRVTVYFIY